MRAVLHNVDAASANPTPINANNPLPVKAYPSTSGGLSLYRFLSTAAVQAAAVKASAGQVYSVEFFNINATAVFVRLYNKATTPGTADTPVWSGVIPAAGSLIQSWEAGLQFATGIGIRVSAAIADNDATALTANTVMGNVSFK